VSHWRRSARTQNLPESTCGPVPTPAVDADQGLRVNALVTGNADTPLYRRLSGVSVDADDELPAPNPTGRVASPAEIAGFAAFLLSDESAFITGAALAIDGGFTAQ